VPLGERFFEVYRSLNGNGFQAAKEFTAAVRRRSAEIRRKLFARRSGRCLEHNLRFNPVRLGGLRWWVRIDFLNDRLKALLADPDGALALGERMFKTGPNRQSTVGAFDGAVLKRFNTKNRLNYLKNLFRPSRAFRAYQKAYHLELLGLPTPKPIAAAERRVLRVLLNSYLVTEEIPGATDLGAILKSGSKPDRELVRQAGHLIGRLHAEGFSHADLKETNLVRGSDGRLYLLDLDALEFLKKVPDERDVADLARLLKGANKFSNVTREDRFAFLLAYCRSRNIRRLPRGR
jgi:tRNA A-37 threonylcarbamoyl transferase component Bud32